MPFSDVIGHERAKALLQAAMARERLAHAYLLYGTERIGKRLLAIRLAQALLCEATSVSSEKDGCSQCRGCRQIPAQQTLILKVFSENLRDLRAAIPALQFRQFSG